MRRALVRVLAAALAFAALPAGAAAPVPAPCTMRPCEANRPTSFDTPS